MLRSPGKAYSDRVVTIWRHQSWTKHWQRTVPARSSLSDEAVCSTLKRATSSTATCIGRQSLKGDSDTGTAKGFPCQAVKRKLFFLWQSHVFRGGEKPYKLHINEKAYGMLPIAVSVNSQRRHRCYIASDTISLEVRRILQVG